MVIKLPGMIAWCEIFSPSVMRLAFNSDQEIINTDETPNSAIQNAPNPNLHCNTSAAIDQETMIVLGVP